MSDNLLENMDNGKLTGLISVDIRNSFDSIDHKILIRKMQEKIGVHSLELQWFQSYLSKEVKFVLLMVTHPCMLGKLYAVFHNSSR